ncbi:hypothetical protein MSM1_09375 [Mycobacterium sp. SM1]|uniref:phage terminase small subunit n=1 Tax=Mycobacterium sp. SM1 TaxID=2816243 RepID=UPI001BD14C86|nr:hypothetical protein [Mycobacterium sp. SM1]MBS4728541.1 hypothetical protein [Mycobacterium sp. SM1]
MPPLPAYCDWHPAVVDFWESAWRSPMPQEWDESDRHNVLMAARAMQMAWDSETRPTARSAAMAEWRLLLRECGLTPMSRRTLQIEIERSDEATDRGNARRAEKRTATKAEQQAKDPRRGGNPPKVWRHAL